MRKSIIRWSVLGVVALSPIVHAQESPETGSDPATTTTTADPTVVSTDELEYSTRPDEHPRAGDVGVNFGAVLSAPIDNMSNRFDEGWGVTGGINLWLSSRVAIHGQYTYSYYNVDADRLGGQTIWGSMNLHGMNLNLFLEPLRVGPFSLYALAGPGVYYRRASVDRVDGVSAGTYCDPFLFVCYPTAVPITDTIGTRDSWDIGVNAGLGAAITLAETFRIFVEARYNYVWGPSFTDAAGNSRSADMQYVPVVLGIGF